MSARNGPSVSDLKPWPSSLISPSTMRAWVLSLDNFTRKVKQLNTFPQFQQDQNGYQASTHQVSKYMFFELHGVSNKMWPGVTSVHDELSVIIILEHGSFYQVPKLSNGAVNTSQLFKFHVLWRKRKKKLPIAVHIKCSIIIMIYFRIFLQHKSIIL